MARYAHLKPDQIHAELKSHYETQPALFKGQDAHALASSSAADYKNGYELVEQAKSVLREMGAKQTDAAGKQKIDLAINALHEATTAFGNACLSGNNTWQKN